MPPSVVKTKKDEERWREAKQQAKQEHKSRNWAYIMGIFLRRKYHIGGKKAKRPWRKYLKKQAQDKNEILMYFLDKYLSQNLPFPKAIQNAVMDTITLLSQTGREIQYEFLPETMSNIASGIASNITGRHIPASAILPPEYTRYEGPGGYWQAAQNISEGLPLAGFAKEQLTKGYIKALPYLQKFRLTKPLVTDITPAVSRAAGAVKTVGSKSMGLLSRVGRYIPGVTRAFSALGKGLNIVKPLGSAAFRLGRIAAGPVGTVTMLSAPDIINVIKTRKMSDRQFYNKTVQFYKDLKKHGYLGLLGGMFGLNDTHYSLSDIIRYGVIEPLFHPGDVKAIMESAREAQRGNLIEYNMKKFRQKMKNDTYLKNINKFKNEGVITPAEYQAMKHLREKYYWLPRMKQVYQGLMKSK